MSQNDHKGHRERMRARFLQNGLDGFAPHEALEMLLFYAIPRQNTNPLAHQLLRQFGTLSAVLNAPVEALAQVPGVGEQTAALIALTAQIARLAGRERFGEKPTVSNFKQARTFCAQLFEAATEEVLYVVCLDAQSRVLRAVPAIVGTIDEIAIYPRTIVSTAILHNAHSVLLAHNHPSGVREPSDADLRTTELLRAALEAVDIALLDHVIYADGDCVSISRWQQIQRVATVLEPAGAPKAADTQRSRKRGPSAIREPEDE